MSQQVKQEGIQFVPKEDTPELRRAAEVATEIFKLRPEFREHVNTEAQEELMRQLGYGLPPSEGMPDVRPKFPRYQS